MKPVDFDLHRPRTVQRALDLLARHADDDVKVLAGGQSLVPLLNFRLARPRHVVDVGGIAALSEIRRTADAVVIGATARQAHAERSRAVAEDVPLLAAALPHIAHPPIRNRGTVGGSLAHADAAAELPSVAVALDVTLVAASRRGRREIPAAEFFRTHLTTSLAADELLTEVRFPRAAPGTGAAFAEVGRRRGDFALVGVAAQIQVTDGRIAAARLAVSGVDQVPHRCREAEALLTGEPPGRPAFEAAAEAVRATLRPSGDLHATADYRRSVAGTLLTRALADAARNATAPAAASAA